MNAPIRYFTTQTDEVADAYALAQYVVVALRVDAGWLLGLRGRRMEPEQ